MATAGAGGGHRKKRAWRKPREAMGPGVAETDGGTSVVVKAARTEQDVPQQVQEFSMPGGQAAHVQPTSTQHVPLASTPSLSAPVEIDGSIMEGVREIQVLCNIDRTRCLLTFVVPGFLLLFIIAM